MTGERTANGRFFQLSDGRVQAEISATPVNYRDAKGRYQPIDTTVGPIDRPGFVQGDSTNTKNQAAGDFVVTPAPLYDANDNVVKSTAANGAVTTASYDKTDQVVATVAPVDVTGDPERKTTFTYDKVGNLLTTTEPKGNLSAAVADYTTINAYDAIYQLTSVVNAEAQKIYL